jgi:hypothetical protein
MLAQAQISRNTKSGRKPGENLWTNRRVSHGDQVQRLEARRPQREAAE